MVYFKAGEEKIKKFKQSLDERFSPSRMQTKPLVSEGVPQPINRNKKSVNKRFPFICSWCSSANNEDDPVLDEVKVSSHSPVRMTRGSSDE